MSDRYICTLNKRRGMPATCFRIPRSDYVNINHISHLICRTYALHGGSSRVYSGSSRCPTGVAGLCRSAAVVLSSGRTCTVLAGSRRKAGHTSRLARRRTRRPMNTRGSRRASPWSPGSRNDQNSCPCRGL